LNNEISELKKSSEIFLKTETQLKEKISGLNSQLTNAKDEIDVISGDVEEKASLIETKNKENAKLNSRVTTLQEELNGLNSILQSKNDEISNLENEIAKMKSEWADQSELQRLKDDLDSISNQLSQRDKESFELNNEKNGFLEKIRNLEQIKEKEIAEINTQVIRVQEELNEAKAALQSKNDQVNNLESTVAKLKNDAIDESELQRLNDDLNSALTQLSEKERENAELNSQIAKSQNELNDLATTLQSKNNQINNLENSIAQLKNDAVDQSELQKLKDDLNSVLAQLSEKEKNITELNNEKSDFLEKIRSLEQIKERKNAEFNEQVTKLQEELSEVKVSLQSKDDQINNLENSIAHDLDSVSVQLSQKENDLIELNNEKISLLDKIKNLEQIIEENENKSSRESENSRNEVEEARNNIIEKERVIEQLKDDMEKLQSTNSEIVKILTAAKKSYQDEIKVKDEQISNLNRELENLNNSPGEGSKIYKTEDQISKPDMAANEPSIDTNIDLENNDTISPEIHENISENQILSEDDEILSKSTFISSASSNSFDDNCFECLGYNDIYIVNINLSRATMEDARPLSKFLSDIINSNKTKLIINLTRCEYIDSSVLGALVNTLKKVTSLDGDLRIVWPDQGGYSMLHLTRMDKVFQIFSNLKDAVESYQ